MCDSISREEFYEEENDFTSELLDWLEEDMFQESKEQQLMDELAMKYCGCPFDIIDEVVDKEVATHYKQLIINELKS
jgi:hypothetical protein